jgi:hypothetical protein
MCDIRFHRLSSSADCRHPILATAVPPAAVTTGIVTGGAVTSPADWTVDAGRARNRFAARHSVVPI